MHSTNPIRMIAMISSFSLAPHSAARSPAALKRPARTVHPAASGGQFIPLSGL